MASNSCHGKLWLLKAGNPRRTFRLRSVFSTFPTDRKFEFNLGIEGTNYVLVATFFFFFLPAILTVEVYRELRYYYLRYYYFIQAPHFVELQSVSAP